MGDIERKRRGGDADCGGERVTWKHV